MVNYKLTYFNVRGRAEVARLLFAKAGVEYEDHRIKKEDWATLKEKTPFGGLPILHVDGIEIGQSYAVVMFLAKRFGLNGKDDIEEAQINMVCQCVHDTMHPTMAIMMEADAERKEGLKKKMTEEQLPNNLKMLNSLLERNEGGDGFFIGNKMTVADIFFSNSVNIPPMGGVTVDLSKFPKLKALKARVESDPKIAEWIKKRPETSF